MGFNAMQPGRIKRSDVLFFVAGLVVIAALVVWAVW